MEGMRFWKASEGEIGPKRYPWLNAKEINLNEML